MLNMLDLNKLTLKRWVLEILTLERWTLKKLSLKWWNLISLTLKRWSLEILTYKMCFHCSYSGMSDRNLCYKLDHRTGLISRNLRDCLSSLRNKYLRGNWNSYLWYSWNECLRRTWNQLRNRCLNRCLRCTLNRLLNKSLRNRLSNRLIKWHLWSNWTKLLCKRRIPNSVCPRVRSTKKRLSYSRLTQTGLRYLTIFSSKRLTPNHRNISYNRLSYKGRIRWFPSRRVINTSWGYLRVVWVTEYHVNLLVWCHRHFTNGCHALNSGCR